MCCFSDHMQCKFPIFHVHDIRLTALLTWNSSFYLSICTSGRRRRRGTALFDQSWGDRIWRHQIRLQNRFCKYFEYSFASDFAVLSVVVYGVVVCNLIFSVVYLVPDLTWHVYDYFLWVLTLCFQLCSILMRIHTLKIKFSPKSFTWMKAETHLQNQLRSNGNLERYVSVYLGEAIAAVCDTIIFICVPFTFFIIAVLSSPFHPFPSFLYV